MSEERCVGCGREAGRLCQACAVKLARSPGTVELPPWMLGFLITVIVVAMFLDGVGGMSKLSYFLVVLGAGVFGGFIGHKADVRARKRDLP